MLHAVKSYDMGMGRLALLPSKGWSAADFYHPLSIASDLFEQIQYFSVTTTNEKTLVLARHVLI
jgi:hypothetical protein